MTEISANRIAGWLLGTALGDAFCAPNEFSWNVPFTGKLEHAVKVGRRPVKVKGEKKYIHRHAVPGQTTDDTEMTLIVANRVVTDFACKVSTSTISPDTAVKIATIAGIASGLPHDVSGKPETRVEASRSIRLKSDASIENKSAPAAATVQCKYDKDAAILDYIAWANSGAMLGRNTRKLFKGVVNVPGYQTRFNSIFATSEMMNAMQSNGALMRCGALAFTYNNDAVIADCALTNPNLVSCDCNLVYTTCLRLLVEGNTPSEAVKRSVAIAQTPEVKSAANDAAKMLSEPRSINMKASKGWCVNALYVALGCLSSFTGASGFIDLMAWIIAHRGSDTDTLAAIAGGLYGSYIGYSELLKDKRIADAALTLFNVDTSKGNFPRPEKYVLRADTFSSIVAGLSAIAAMRYNALHNSIFTTQAVETMRGYRLAIIGDELKITAQQYKALIPLLYRTIVEQIQIDPKNIVLISAAQAGPAHSTLSLWLTYAGLFRQLELNLPYPFSVGRFVPRESDLGADAVDKLNSAHELFSKNIDHDTLADISKIIDSKTANVKDVRPREINDILADVDHLIIVGELSSSMGIVSEMSNAKKLQITL
jgi:ADP-ribosylglycohydrolase